MDNLVTSNIRQRPIRTLVNTHHHGDHTHGNHLFGRYGPVTIVGMQSILPGRKPSWDGGRKKRGLRAWRKRSSGTLKMRSGSRTGETSLIVIIIECNTEPRQAIEKNFNYGSRRTGRACKR